MNDKIITVLLAVLIALSGWSLTTTVGLKSDVAVLKEKVSGLKMKFRTLKLFQRRRNARKRKQTTDRAVQALIIGLALVMVLLVGCSYRMVPNETKIEYGTTETDSKNDKLQQKQSISQSWKWIKE